MTLTKYFDEYEIARLIVGIQFASEHSTYKNFMHALIFYVVSYNSILDCDGRRFHF